MRRCWRLKMWKCACADLDDGNAVIWQPDARRDVRGDGDATTWPERPRKSMRVGSGL